MMADEDGIALSQRIRAEVPYYKAPAHLRERILATTRASSQAVEAPRARWHWLWAGGLAGSLATVLAFLIVTAALDRRTSDDLALEAVNVHVRATLGQRVIQVASSDQHTVKPWLSARLDYSPPVPLMEGSGFVLTGGRLDYLEQRPVATLVYKYREHVVDVFVRPVPTRPVSLPLRTIRGFHVAHAQGGQMDWIAVSDVSAEVLEPFVRALAAQ